MKIKLEYLLRKKYMSLADFCKLNSLDDFSSLQQYCDSKNMICVDELFYNQAMPNKISKESKVKSKESPRGKPEVKSEKRATERRSPSKTPKVTKKRASRSKSTSQ